MLKFIENQVFTDLTTLTKAEYELCTFKNCNFADADLGGTIFTECNFEHCDFSMATIKETAFRSVKFKNCKLLGLNFYECHHFLLAFHFESCTLNYSSFEGLSLKQTIFKDCNLEGVEFIGTDLSHVSFTNSTLRDATFEDCNLENADFRTALHFRIDPESNKMHKAKFSSQNVAGLLEKYKIEIG